MIKEWKLSSLTDINVLDVCQALLMLIDEKGLPDRYSAIYSDVVKASNLAKRYVKKISEG